MAVEVLQTALDAIASGRKIREVRRSFYIAEATQTNQRSMSKLGRKQSAITIEE